MTATAPPRRLAAWTPPAADGLAARALVAAGASVRITGEAELRAALEAGPPGALLVVDAAPIVHDALAAGWIVVTCARHEDARHGHELVLVAGRAEEPIGEALRQVASLDARAQAAIRAAARALAEATDRATFAARWSPPRVSVVLVAGGDARAVDAAAAVLGQTFAELELIVVDDGGLDAGARARLAAQDDPRLVLCSCAWAGPGAARSLGLRLARGRDHVACLEPGDAWSPRLLERLVEALDPAPPPVGLAWCDARLEQEGAPPRALVTREATVEALLRGDRPPIGAVLVRRAAVVAAGAVDEELLAGADEAWLLALLSRAEAVRVPDALVTVRRPPTAPVPDPLEAQRLARAAERALDARRRRPTGTS